MQDQLSVKVDALGKDALINAAKTSMSSKVIGGYVHITSDSFQNLDFCLQR